MGPLLPIGLLFGGLWFLDENQKREQAMAASAVPPPARFSALAISLVSKTAEGIRAFNPEADAGVRDALKRAALVRAELPGMPGGVLLYRLAPLSPGADTADTIATSMTDKGLAMLASLSVVLAGPETEHYIVFGSPTGVQRFANERGVFALVRSSLPTVATAPTAAEAVERAIANADLERPKVAPPSIEKEPVVEVVETKSAPRAKTKANGVANGQPEAPAEVTIEHQVK